MLETADVPSSATNRLSEHHRDDHDDNFCHHDDNFCDHDDNFCDHVDNFCHLDDSFCDHDDDHRCDIGPDRQHGDGVGHNLQKSSCLCLVQFWK